MDVLRAMQLTGCAFLDAEFTAPWCVGTRIGPEHCAASLPTTCHVIAYHYVTEGRCLLEVEGYPATEVRAGEIVLLPRNDPHRLGSAPGLRPTAADSLIRPGADGRLARIVHGGGGERTRLLCGFLGSSLPNPPIAKVLPVALTVGVDDAATGAWIESSFGFAARELAAGRPESPAVVARLAELLFIEAVRRHVASRPAEGRGWIAGVRDPVVGRALALVHGGGTQRWTVAELARESGASRSSFADRFTSLIGESPMRYLSRQRLRGAARQLRESGEAVAGVAMEAGYGSEAAFCRAFKREFGQSPLAWRKGRTDG